MESPLAHFPTVAVTLNLPEGVDSIARYCDGASLDFVRAGGCKLCPIADGEERLRAGWDARIRLTQRDHAGKGRFEKLDKPNR